MGYNPNGTSGQIRLIDLGLITVADVAAGAVTPYTAQAGEIVGPVFFRDWQAPDVDLWLVVSFGDQWAPPYVTMAALDGSRQEGFDSAGIVVEGDGLPSNNNPTGVQKVTPIALGQSPVIGISNGCYGYGVCVPWEANHSVDCTLGQVMVVGDGHAWAAGASGTTGPTTPDFAGNIGGTVTDNDTVWTDVGALPAVGQAHFYVQVSTPTAP